MAITPTSSFTSKAFQLEKQYKEERIAAVAVALIAMVLTGVGLILMGIGTNPSTMDIGYGVFPYLAGSQLVLLGLFTATLALVPSSMSLYHRLQWKKEIAKT